MANNRLTAGNPTRVIMRFCLPLFGSVLFQQMYNIADSLVAGKILGEQALAAVGNSYEITLVYLAFAFGCNMGCSVVSATLFGEKKYRSLLSCIYTSLILTSAVCAVLMASGLLFGDGILGLIHTPENIFNDSLVYLRIYTMGLPFLFFYNLSCGVFSALGDSVRPFIFLAVSSVSNIFADILFLKAFGMGVEGVAWATFICQGLSCIAAVTAMIIRVSRTEKGGTDIDPDDGAVRAFSPSMLKKIIRVAVPSTLQQCFVSVGNIFIQGMINICGSSVIAGYSAAIKLNNLVITSYNTISTGVSSFTAQNYGAGKYDRIRPGYRGGILFTLIITVPVMILYLVFGQSLVGLFMDSPSAQSLESGYMFLKIAAPFYAVITLKIMADGVLRGMTRMKYFMISTFSDLILRVVFAYIFSSIFTMGYIGIWLAWPIGWVLSTVMSYVFYRVQTGKMLSEHKND